MANTTLPKVCASCAIQKPAVEFGIRYKQTKTGLSPFLHSYCKLCQYEKNKTRRESGQVKVDPRYHRLWQLRNKYNLTEQQYEDMLEMQDYKCGICEVELDDSPHVDHCHTTGKVRGILCGPCNKGLGFLKDDPNLLREALKYLEGKVWNA